VIERELALTSDEGIPVSVPSLRTPEPLAKLLQEQRAGKQGPI
jgi:hypothetical protein